MSARMDVHIDAIGNRHYPVEGSCRIVSLVPSLTELLFDLGLGEYMVGRTGFCIHPRSLVKQVPKIGGTKDVKVDAIRQLEPTHLVVNVDENRRDTVEEIAEFVPHVIATHPCTPADNIELYKLFGGVFGREDAAQSLASELRHELYRLEVLREKLPRYYVLYLIWRKPWMTVSRDTYISSMLNLINWITIAPTDGRRYPIIEDIADMANRSNMVLLSSEPYRFRRKHVEECLKLAPSARVRLVDGELLSWYGSRAIPGLRYLVELAENNLLNSDADSVSVH